MDFFRTREEPSLVQRIQADAGKVQQDFERLFWRSLQRQPAFRLRLGCWQTVGLFTALAFVWFTMCCLRGSLRMYQSLVRGENRCRSTRATPDPEAPLLERRNGNIAQIWNQRPKA